MAAGDLSDDQARYRSALAAATGLDRTVITSWIGAESGWGRTKTGANYLNIGPGRNYSSTTEAAQAAAELINESGHYGTIREAIASGDPRRQVGAIAASPWDAGHYGGDGSNLAEVYSQLAGEGSGGWRGWLTDVVGWAVNPGAQAVEQAAEAGAGRSDEGGISVPGPAGDIIDTVTNPVGKVAELLGSGTVRDLIVRSGLTIFLLGAAGWLIVSGLLRATRIDNTAWGLVTDILPG